MVSYGELYKACDMKAREIGRKKIVELYDMTKSISETARRCRTTRNVVRKWVSQEHLPNGWTNDRKAALTPFELVPRLRQLSPDDTP